MLHERGLTSKTENGPVGLIPFIFESNENEDNVSFRDFILNVSTKLNIFLSMHGISFEEVCKAIAIGYTSNCNTSSYIPNAIHTSLQRSVDSVYNTLNYDRWLIVIVFICLQSSTTINSLIVQTGIEHD